MKHARRALSMLLIVALLAAFLPAGAQQAEAARYTDVHTNDWFYEPVMYVSDQGIMTGTGAETFSPQTVTSRGMIVTILHRMEGEPAAEAADFSDVAAGRYYSEAIAWASAHGIVSGYGNGTFGPDAAITREQMASILYRYAEYKGADTSARDDLSDFVDADAVSPYALEVMQWAVGAGLIAGQSADTLAPKTNSTRAVAATILMRYCQNILGDDADVDEPLEPTVETVDLGNGDSIYALTDEQVAFDFREGMHYVDNILLAFVEKGLSASQKEQIAEKVDGAIVGELKGDLNLLQIEVEAANLSALRTKARTLMQDSRVNYATIDAPSPVEEIDVAASTSDTNTYGDWWYALVGADTAWETYGNEFGSITVGVIDGGINPLHEEFGGDVSFASDRYYDWNHNDTLLGATDSTVRHAVDHGTHVAGIIAADHDGDAVNGIAPNAKIVFADFAASASASDTQRWQSAASAVSALKACVAKGAKVINCSFGKHYYSQQKFEALQQEERDDNVPVNEQYYNAFSSWGDYMAARNATATEVAGLTAAATCELLANGKDFLVVQAAGNGIDNAGPGVDARYASFWAGINENNAETICDSYGMSYDELNDHILIVSSITRAHDGDVYEMDPDVNYGDAVDIYAPGVEILSTVAYDAQNVVDLDETDVLSGTSMAAPIVSGAAALVWSADSSLSASEVRELLLNNHFYTASGVYNGEAYSNYPVVDVFAAVRAALGGDPAPETGGSGTAEDPYRISTAAELKALADTVNQGGVDDDYSQRGVYYELTADIDLSAYDNWTPIGNSALHTFSGHFDGNGYKISGLRIYDEIDAPYLGLFGNVFYAEITDVTLEGVNLRHVSGAYSGGKEIGAIAGHVHGSTISDCLVTGTVSVVASPYDLDTKVGGVIGTLWGESTVSGCIAAVDVLAASVLQAGGVVGRAQATTAGGISISGCINSGQVLSCGDGDNSIYGYVDNCYVNGTLTTWHPTPV